MGDGDNGEDKLLKRARELEQEPMAVAEYFSRRHFEAMDRLGVIRPDISPRATGHITEQLEAIEQLIEKGLAYESNGSVYFEIKKDPKYGELSNREIDQMLGGARVDVRKEKRHPGDFALWKRAEPGHLMRWRDTFSGWGYPGWPMNLMDQFILKSTRTQNMVNSPTGKSIRCLEEPVSMSGKKSVTPEISHFGNELNRDT